MGRKCIVKLNIPKYDPSRSLNSHLWPTKPSAHLKNECTESESKL